MSNDKMREILDAPDKLVSRTTNPLARLMRVILLETDIDASTFYRLLDMYVKTENSELAKTEKSSFKTNLVAALTAPKLQILGFERFLKLLNPKSVRFSVTLTWRNGGRQTYDVDLDVIGAMDDDLKGNSWDDVDELGVSDEYLDDEDKKRVVEQVRGNLDYYLTEILKPTGNPYIDKKVKKIVDDSEIVGNSQSLDNPNESDVDNLPEPWTTPLSQEDALRVILECATNAEYFSRVVTEGEVYELLEDMSSRDALIKLSHLLQLEN